VLTFTSDAVGTTLQTFRVGMESNTNSGSGGAIGYAEGHVFAEGEIPFSNDYDIAATVTFGSDMTNPPLQYASVPFSEGFETGTLQPFWQASGTGQNRIQVTSANAPNSGSYHLTMDDTTDDTNYSRNELTLGIDLAGQSNVDLVFWPRISVTKTISLPLHPSSRKTLRMSTSSRGRLSPPVEWLHLLKLFK
jgi:hypothetical protein